LTIRNPLLLFYNPQNLILQNHNLQNEFLFVLHLG